MTHINMTSQSLMDLMGKTPELLCDNYNDSHIKILFNFLTNLFMPHNWTSGHYLFIKAFIAAITSGLGGIPLYFIGELPDHIMGFCIIFAAGLMTGCSVVLFMEALDHTTLFNALFYTIIGILLIHFLNYFIEKYCESNDCEEGFTFSNLKGKSAIKSVLIILSMGLHSLGEGISVGVSASSQYESIGLLVIISLAIHNIPEGIAVCLILMHKGMNVFQSSLYAFISNIPQPLIAVPAFLFMDHFQSLLPIGFSIASGAMFYIVVHELIPETQDKISKRTLISTFCTSLGIIIAIAVCAK